MGRRLQEAAAPFMLTGALIGGTIGGGLAGLLDVSATEGVHRTWIEDERTYTYGDAMSAAADGHLVLAQTIAEADKAVDDLLDERCTVAIAPYRSGGEFADVDENGVVSDLVGDPQLPCQNLPRQARAIIRFARSQDARVADAQKTADIRDEELAIFNQYEADDHGFNAVPYGAVPGSIVGALFGLALAIDNRKANRRAEDAGAEVPAQPGT